jgi:hypothetical protein
MESLCEEEQMKRFSIKNLNRLFISSGITYLLGSLMLGWFLFKTVYFIPYSFLYFISLIFIISHMKITERVIKEVEKLEKKNKRRH